MKKYIKYAIILVIIIGVLLGLKYLLTPSMKTQIEEYLVSQGYNSTEYEDLYEKNDTENKKYSFSLADYTFMLNSDDDDNDMNKSLTATYNYKTESITYSYRVYNSESLNVYFKGTYKDEEFTCEKEFSSATISDVEQENICSLARIDIKMFDLQAKTLFTKYKYIDYIKNR